MALFQRDENNMANEKPLFEAKENVQGRIFHLDEDEGWGFIESDEIKFERIFFHWTALLQETLRFPKLEKGMQVRFKAINTPDKGWKAINVEVIEDGDS